MKILLHFRHFPVAMGRFFHWALQDLGHETFTVGPYSKGKIPWGDNFYYPNHKFPPNFQTPAHNFSIEETLKSIDFKPDIIIQAADTIWLTGKSPVPNIVIGTDPHVINYAERLQYADDYFCMQDCYKSLGATWLPYAYDPYIHIKKEVPQEFDVVFSGLQYEHRIKAIDAMKKAGLNVRSTLGLIYDDYVDEYAKGKIAFNYSSMQDLPARFWEGLGMGRLMLTNKVPDLDLLEFKDGVDYVGYSTIEEAVEKAKYYSENDTERIKIAQNGYDKVRPHTYQNRCKTLLQKYES